MGCVFGADSIHRWLLLLVSFFTFHCFSSICLLGCRSGGRRGVRTDICLIGLTFRGWTALHVVHPQPCGSLNVCWYVCGALWWAVVVLHIMVKVFCCHFRNRQLFIDCFIADPQMNYFGRCNFIARGLLLFSQDIFKINRGSYFEINNCQLGRALLKTRFKSIPPKRSCN